MKNLTIDELMSTLGCDSFPERWREIYGEAMEMYARGENPLLDPEYYDKLQAKYRLFEGEMLGIYKKAAELISKKTELSMFFCLLCRALRDRSVIQADISRTKFPEAPKGEDTLPYDMLTALSMLQGTPAFYEQMRSHNVPDDIIYASLKIPVKCVETHLRRNNRPLLSNFDWYQLAYDGKLYRIGRLQIEFPMRLPNLYRVYESKNGEMVSFSNLPVHRDGFPLGSRNYTDEEGSFIATVEETDDAYIGYPHKKDGHISTEKISLPKTEWKEKLKAGDQLIALHIPPDESFDDSLVESSLAEIKQLMKEHYPDYQYKGFFCGSWLMDPALVDILGEGSNISKFCKRFIPMPVKADGNDVFNYVYKINDKDVKIEELPENTRLQRALKQHYLNGKAIYMMHGVFF